MTKFTKGILTIAFIAGVGVGVKYLYDNFDFSKYTNKVRTTNVSKEVVAEINEFVNDINNIGFIQSSYDVLDINKYGFDTIYALLNNRYEWGSNGLLESKDLVDSSNYKKYGHSYSGSLNDKNVCYKTKIMNQHLESITNQKLDANGKNSICTEMIDIYQYIAKVDVTRVLLDDDRYSVDYTGFDAEYILYTQRHPEISYTTFKSYDGTVVLKKNDKGGYIFISNTIDTGKKLG